MSAKLHVAPDLREPYRPSKITMFNHAGEFRNNGMGGTLGAVYMAKILYPDLFTDLNPQAIHQEYITHFLRLNYNLDTNGVFLYPAITVNGDTVGVPNGAS
jgi:hypothetical protein